MTREEILNTYEVNPWGVIRTPGKFENEMLYTPYFYDLSLEGLSDNVIFDGDTEIHSFLITNDDAEAFPELSEDIGKFLDLWSDEQGFIYTSIK